MTTFASIPERPTRITGFPHSGWRAADADDPTSKVLPFRFDITDDGGGNILLCYHSLDRVFCADTWHQTLEEAFAVAQEVFGITRSEWQPPVPNNALQRTAHGGHVFSAIHVHPRHEPSLSLEALGHQKQPSTMSFFRFRIPSPRKSFAARTSAKRFVRHSLGMKAPRGMGIVTNPKHTVQNAVYRNTTIGVNDVGRVFTPARRGRSPRLVSAQMGCVFALIQLGLMLWLLHWMLG